MSDRWSKANEERRQEWAESVRLSWAMIESGLQKALDRDVLELEAFQRMRTVIQSTLDPHGRVFH